MTRKLCFICGIIIFNCNEVDNKNPLGIDNTTLITCEKVTGEKIPEPDFTITVDQQTHNKFSSKIPPLLTVSDGYVIEAFTQKATGS